MILSIVIPNYNYGEFLRELLIRINDVEQRSEIEVIVVDAESKDSTLTVCQSLLKSHDILISEKDKGQSDALTKGLRLARGRYYMHQNSDDLIDIEGLNKIIEVLLSTELTGNYNFISGLYGEMKKYKNKWSEIVTYRPPRRFFRFLLARNLYFPNQSTIYLTEKAKKISYDVDLNFAMDLDFVIRFTDLYGLNYRTFDLPLGYLRIHDQSKTSTIQDTCKQESIMIRKRNFSLLSRFVSVLIYPFFHLAKKLSVLV